MATKNHEEAVIARNSSKIYLYLEKIQIYFEINFDKWQFIPN